jgi:hypothetical protein
MKKASKLVERVNGLANSPNKNAIRTDIVNQVVDFTGAARGFLNGNAAPLSVLTLPGTNFHFELMLTSTMNYWSGRKVGVEFECFELNPERFQVARESGIPKNCTHRLGDVVDASGQYDMTWLDLCSTIVGSKDTIRNLVRRMRIGDKPMLFYVTFCMTRVDYAEFGQQYGSPGCTPRRVVERYLEGNCFKQAKLDYRKVYSVHYAGGTRDTVSMMTVGYIVSKSGGLPIGDRVRLMQEDRRYSGAECLRRRPCRYALVRERKPDPVNRDPAAYATIVKQWRAGCERKALRKLLRLWRGMSYSEKAELAGLLKASVHTLAARLIYCTGKLRRL